jgi:TPR repeat protein
VRVQEMMRRVEANDPGAICMLAYHYEYKEGGLQQDYAKAKELYTRAADLGCSKTRILIWQSFIVKGAI